MPAGVEFELRVEHEEQGLHCTGTIRMKLAGGPGLIAWLFAAATLAIAALLVRAGLTTPDLVTGSTGAC